MAMNLYTCSQADLETLEGIGPKSASDIIALRNEVLAGQRPKITVTHLAQIRLQTENWQAFIDQGLLSITFHASVDPDQTEKMQIPPANPLTENTLSPGQTVTFGQTMITEQATTVGQTVTTEQQTVTTIAQTMDNGLYQLPPPQTGHTMTQGKLKIHPVQGPLEESVGILGHQFDHLNSQMHNLGMALTEKLTLLIQSMDQLQQNSNKLQSQLSQQNKTTSEMQTKLSVHDTFMADISKWIPPPVPISHTLPIYKTQPNTPPPSGVQMDQKSSLVQTFGQLATPNAAKAIVTQPVSLNIPVSTPTHFTAVSQPISSTIPLDVKPKHPQQLLIDNIAAAIPKSAIFSSTINPVAAAAKHTVLTAADSIPNTEPPAASIQNTTQTGQPQSVTGQIQTVHMSQTETSTGQMTGDRGRSRHRKSRSRRSTSADSSSQSNSPPPPRLQLFSGDSAGQSWSSFIMKFDRIATRKGWTDQKKLDRLYDCLTEKALEYTARSDNKDNYNGLKQELALRFDLKEEPIAARQRLTAIRQDDDETLEDYLQRILTITLDGFIDERSALIQQVSTEAFLIYNIIY